MYHFQRSTTVRAETNTRLTSQYLQQSGGIRVKFCSSWCISLPRACMHRVSKALLRRTCEVVLQLRP